MTTKADTEAGTKDSVDPATDDDFVTTEHEAVGDAVTGTDAEVIDITPDVGTDAPAAPLRLRAQVLQELKIGADVEWVEADVFNDKGELVGTKDIKVSTPIYAQPGDIIDVSDWASLDAYVRRGQIVLIPPDVKDHPAAEDNTAPSKPKRQPRQSAAKAKREQEQA